MKKITSLILVVLMLAALLAGCGAAPDAPQTPGAAAPAGDALGGRVGTNGSTSMEKVIGALNEAFMLANTGIDVTYEPTGSGAGITAATEGTADVGLSSRALKDEEKANLDEIVLALDGIAIIVNKENTVADLTLEQIAGLYTGAITNWNQVGGPDAPVVAVGREAGSGTRDGFESITGTKDVCVYTQELTATGAVIAAVESNVNAIGYASLASIKDTVKAITVGGVAPTEATVQDGSYAVQRPFVVAVQKGAALRPEVQAYLTFIQDPANAEIISNAGAIPISR